ncbi:hypothetical protein, variant [Blastomyces dermatitidis ATCC 18188]|uniref:Uncharacterized protein n=1 Tax=Ajellomyces dermatitidis (strain ATCC 18188 / CBS 674.68) TaxID=653446 RepID=A0A0J9EQA3_AJEDA|nr:hypothetical protein, variant [Blastomyces dermatitidis ATCC 18188]
MAITGRRSQAVDLMEGIASICELLRKVWQMFVTFSELLHHITDFNTHVLISAPVPRVQSASSHRSTTTVNR